MFTRKTSPVLIGILFLSSMYLMGQGGWGPDPCGDSVCPCGNTICGANGTCVNNGGVAECHCDAGYDGEFCDNNIPDCPEPDPCVNGSCVDGIESYTCDCDDGYEGDSCETNIDDCDPDPCLNDGICTDVIDSYSCECVDGYTGEKCEIPPDMVALPSGCFSMGDWAMEGRPSEIPSHQVCLSAFVIDIHEITNGEYAECVADGWCAPPRYANSVTRGTYYGDPAYDDFPVIQVDWYKVSDYCHWAGKRLPTEAEWEYAARGGLVGKRYPWGDTISSTDANYGAIIGDTTMVESYAPNGYGLYDVGGNVWEWVEDDFHDNYYGAPTDGSAWVDEPRNPNRVLRGGSWFFDAYFGVRVAYREFEHWASYETNQAGGRCVADMRDILY